MSRDLEVAREFVSRGTKTRKRAHPIPIAPIPQGSSHVVRTLLPRAGGLVAHLLIVIASGLVVLVVVLIILHRVRVLGVHILPVNVLATRATPALDDVLLGDGLEIAVVLLILVV